MNTVYYTIIFFIFGLFFGSFFNVVGLRVPKKESIIYPPSHCPNCNHKLSWYELLPVISYIFLKGKCKVCKEKISIIYPLIELLTGILFGLSYYIFGFTLETIFSIILTSQLIIIIVSDFKYMIIPDEIIIIGFISLIIVSLFSSGLYNTSLAIITGIASFLIMYLIKIIGDKIYKKETMGGGDIKLMIIIGFVLGLPLGITSIFLASFIALPIAIIVLATKKTNVIPFGPFLAFACLIFYFLQIDFAKIIELLYK